MRKRDHRTTGLTRGQLEDLGVFTPATLAEHVRTTMRDMDPDLIDGLVRERSVNLIAGESGLGKTPLMQMLGVAVAAGVPVLGRKVQRGRVLYLDGETPQPQFSEQLTAVSRHLDLDRPPEWFHVYSPNWVTSGSFDGQGLLRWVRKMGDLALVCLDPLRCFWPEAESKNAVAATVIRELRKVSAVSGCAWLIAHHLRKPDEKVTRPDLETEPQRWLDQVCGARALVNQTDLRIGFEEHATGGRGHPKIILNGLLRGVGIVGPMYLERTYGDDGTPLGYKVLRDIDLLPAGAANVYRELPARFRFKDVQRVLGGQSASNANNCLRRFVALGLVQQQQNGEYWKVKRGDGVGGVSGVRLSSLRFSQDA